MNTKRICTSLAFVWAFSLTGVNIQAMNESKGIGPVTEVKLDPLDVSLATKGKDVFVSKCSACHKMEERYVGPGLKGITTRRTPEWIMNMIMNPQEMTQKDPEAQKLLEEYLMQMTFQNVSQEETRSIVEYFRHYDEKGEIVAATKPAQDKKEASKTKSTKKGKSK